MNGSIKFGDQTIDLKKYRLETCKHQDLTMDDDTQFLECNNCGKMISAYTFLRSKLSDVKILLNEKAHLTTETVNLSIEVTELKRQKRNLKANIAKLRAAK